MPRRLVFNEKESRAGFLDKEEYEREKERYRQMQGRRIAEARGRAKLSQQDLADRIGVHKNQIHLYESGQNFADLLRIWQIAQATRKPLSFFLPREMMTENEAQVLDTFLAGFLAAQGGIDPPTKH